MFNWFWNIIGRKAVEPIKNKVMQCIDISKWNGVIDFKKLATESDKVFIRAGNGAKTDEKFLLNAKGCIANNIQWGAYFFFNFTQDPATQANKFASIVESAGAKPSLPLVLDIETNEKTLPITGKQLLAACHTFLNILESKNYDTAIYLSPGFSWFLPKGHDLGKYKLWVADYNEPINPVNGWPKAWLHQYSDKGKIAGITTAVDLNKFV